MKSYSKTPEAQGQVCPQLLISNTTLTNPRHVGRKTEEGFAIFKEDELGITDQGGGDACVYYQENRPFADPPHT